MQSKDLEIFNQMPFLFWVKDEESRYVWGNRVINELAGGTVVGKTESELPWAENAAALVAHDRQVLEKGEPVFTNVVPTVLLAGEEEEAGRSVGRVGSPQPQQPA